MLAAAATFACSTAFGQAPQFRPNITSFTAAQQATLATLMQQYITADVINDHCSMNKQMMELPMPAHIHDDVNFLQFHRAYIEKMEDFLYLSGHPEFVPLPAWDPNTPCPTAFRVVDADCGSVASDCTGGGGCNTPTNWGPVLARPSYLKRPVVSGANNDLCDFTPGVGSTSFEQVVEGEFGNVVSSVYHNQVHNGMGGVMLNFRSPATLAFWIWHAYVDDIWKEYQCQCPNQNPSPRQIDLYVKNTPGVIAGDRDLGAEPNWKAPLWTSTDIWVRDVVDDGETNDQTENPEYHQNPAIKTWVYVRVRNRGCVATTGTEQMEVYWSKAGTYQLYPKPWDGVPISGLVMGGLIGSVPVGVIPPGGEKIVKMQWAVPDPYQFGPMDGSTTGSGPADGWHFCLLAKGNNPTVDPDQGTMSNIDLGWIIADNNHVALRNITVVDFSPTSILPPNGQIETVNGGTIAIGNLFPNPEIFDFHLEAIKKDNGLPGLIKQADVVVAMNPLTWQKWRDGGMKQEGIEIYNENERKILIRSEHAILRNLRFDPDELSTINVSFNFLTDDRSPGDTYDFTVSQRRSSDNYLIGGETYTVTRPNRTPFDADAGPDQTINENDRTQVSAKNIGENALYNWYDASGNLIYSGPDYLISPSFTTTYNLEVIATKDGAKDKDQVTVNVRNSFIRTLYPNPASTTLNVEYKLATGTTSAYLVISGASGTTNNYMLNTSSSQTSIDLSRYQPGVYNLSLVRNGVTVDSKTFSKR